MLERKTFTSCSAVSPSCWPGGGQDFVFAGSDEIGVGEELTGLSLTGLAEGFLVGTIVGFELGLEDDGA